MCWKQFRRKNKTIGLGNFHFDWLSHAQTPWYLGCVCVRVVHTKSMCFLLGDGVLDACLWLWYRLGVASFFFAANHLPTTLGDIKTIFHALRFHQMQYCRWCDNSSDDRLHQLGDMQKTKSTIWWHVPWFMILCVVWTWTKQISRKSNTIRLRFINKIQRKILGNSLRRYLLTSKPEVQPSCEIGRSRAPTQHFYNSD